MFKRQRHGKLKKNTYLQQNDGSTEMSNAQLHSKKQNLPGFPLMFATEGELVTICGLRGGGMLQERLLSMGINIGDQIRIIQKQQQGAILIEVHGVRYTLGGGMQQKINVNK